jgi:hypothetical protein
VPVLKQAEPEQGSEGSCPIAIDPLSHCRNGRSRVQAIELARRFAEDGVGEPLENQPKAAPPYLLLVAEALQVEFVARKCGFSRDGRPSQRRGNDHGAR